MLKSPTRSALLVLVAGFGGLFVLWLAGSWRRDLPGLFDYRSATIGDALLLPLIVGLLVAAASRLRSAPRERAWARLGAALGLGLAVTTQVLWLTDDGPRANWTLPEPHHFNFAGWYHAVFLCLASAAIGSLTILVARRIRAAAASGALDASVTRSPWLGALVASAVGLAGLIALDNREASGSQAGTTTTIAMAVTGAATVGVAAWALRDRLRANARFIALGLSAGAGLTALAAHGLSGGTAVAAAAVFLGIVGGVAASEPNLPAGPRFKPLHAIAASLVLLGGMGLALHTVPDDGRVAAAVLLVASIWTVLAGEPRDRSIVDSILGGLALFYSGGVLVLAAWLHARNPTASEARLAADAGAIALELLVIGLVRDRFRDLVRFEERFDRTGDVAVPEATPQAQGPYVWIQLFGFAAPALVGLVVLLVVASRTLGTDVHAGGAPERLDYLELAVIVSGALSALAGLVAVLRARSRRRTADPGAELDVPWSAVGLTVVAAGCWIAACVAALSDLHYPAVAAIAAAVCGALTTEDLVRSSASVQLADVGIRGRLVAVAGGLVTFASVGWLLTTGLWSADGPAGTGASGLSLLVGLGGAAVVVIGFGVVMGQSLRGPVLTPQKPTMNLIMGQLLYTVLYAVAAAIPVFIVGRVAGPGLKNSGLEALGNLSALPAVAAAFIWVLLSLRRHVRFERGAPPPPGVMKLAGGDTALAETLNDERLTRLEGHVDWQVWTCSGLFVAAIVWTAIEVF